MLNFADLGDGLRPERGFQSRQGRERPGSSIHIFNLAGSIQALLQCIFNKSGILAGDSSHADGTGIGILNGCGQCPGLGQNLLGHVLYQFPQDGTLIPLRACSFHLIQHLRPQAGLVSGHTPQGDSSLEVFRNGFDPLMCLRSQFWHSPGEANQHHRTTYLIGNGTHHLEGFGQQGVGNGGQQNFEGMDLSPGLGNLLQMGQPLGRLPDALRHQHRNQLRGNRPHQGIQGSLHQGIAAL